jgi:hypothetical protein
LLSHGSAMHWFSPHHHHQLHRWHLPSSSSPEKEQVNSFLGCHYTYFLIGSYAS